MSDRDHNRSNNSGTGAKTLDRDAEPPTPSHSGSSGGDMQREIGAIDEEEAATGAEPQPTSVHKSMKPRSGDEPNLPNRDGGGPDDRPPRGGARPPLPTVRPWKVPLVAEATRGSV